MANLTVTYFSLCLQRNTTFKMYIPNDKKPWSPMDKPDQTKRHIKTLILLHGYHGDGDIWVNTALCDQYSFAVVAPSGENGFWLDGEATGRKYASFVGSELIDYLRDTFHLALTPDETFVMGLSMGGFGALHTALMFPETFGKCAALSSALIQNEVAKMKEGEGNEVANYEYYRECFGEPSKLAESDNRPENLVMKIKKSGGKMPEIFMSCGTNDFLIERNREFHAFLEKEEVDHTYLEWEGIHDMVFWTQSVEKFVPIMFG